MFPAISEGTLALNAVLLWQWGSNRFGPENYWAAFRPNPIHASNANQQNESA